jgi:hypothetical protein
LEVNESTKSIKPYKTDGILKRNIGSLAYSEAPANQFG